MMIPKHVIHKMKNHVTHWVDVPQLSDDPGEYREPVLLAEDTATIKKEVQPWDINVLIREYR